MSPYVLTFKFDMNFWLRCGAFGGAVIGSLGLAYLLGMRTTLRPHRDRIRETKDNEAIEEFVGKLRLSDEVLREVMRVVNDEISKALDPQPDQTSELKMVNTHIYDIPTVKSTFRGKFLVVDLGGTNFRIAEIDFHDDRTVDERTKVFMIPDRLLTDDGQKLFDHVATCLGSFLRVRNLAYRKSKLPLAFCFSFPCSYTDVRHATLIHWAKGFNCKKTVGEEVGQMLQNAMDNQKETRAEVKAVINDTVGCLTTTCYREKECKIGAIFGSGTNACYIEEVKNVAFLRERVPHKNVVLNVEWGALGDQGSLEFIRTNYDDEIDAVSKNPKVQTFEKMTSRMYLGEIAWQIMQKLIDNDLLFRGILTRSQRSSGYLPSLVSSGILNTNKMQEIEMDEGVNFKRTQQLLAEIGLKDARYEDCAIVKYVCDLVSTRSAQLSGTLLATLINRLQRRNVTIGVDGSMFRHHPRFHKTMEATVSRLVDRDITYKIVLNAEGSAKGAAMVAAMQRESEVITNGTA
ncbi:hypothetical protein ACOME3_004961 [Neoechinorhynchus agilis]